MNTNKKQMSFGYGIILPNDFELSAKLVKCEFRSEHIGFHPYGKGWFFGWKIFAPSGGAKQVEMMRRDERFEVEHFIEEQLGMGYTFDYFMFSAGV
jgi:hypothetical protein